MSVEIIEKVKYLILLKKDKYFIPIVGFNETKRGFFVNYYDSNEHVSRHKTLVAWRLADGKTSLILQDKDITELNNRKSPQELPSKTVPINNCRFEHGLKAKTIKANIKNYDVISCRNFALGPRVIGVVWPNKQKPTKEDMKKYLMEINTRETLIYYFYPTCFNNPFAVGVYKATENSKIIPLAMDGPIQTDSTEYTNIPGTRFTYNAKKSK